MNKITIKNYLYKGLFKEYINTYEITWEKVKSNFAINQIKINDDIIIFKIQRDGKPQYETRKVLKEYVEEIGIEDYINLNIDNWVINYEDKY